MEIVRRTLFEGELLTLGHARARPSPGNGDDLACQPANVLVLPLRGAFAMHGGPRQRALATPGHAVLLAAERLYRMSLPTASGDDALTLRLTPRALAQLAPEAMAGTGFDVSAFEHCAPLEPGVILARTMLWRHLELGHRDPLQMEEAAAHLLMAALRGARRHAATRRRPARKSARGLRQVGRVLEAVSAHPDWKWTLAKLAAIACVSPGHLAHVFREELGCSVYAHVLDARLAKALDAVLETDTTLAEIALEAGFASHSHFTARFRARFGTTPAELRCKATRGIAAELRRIVTARSAAPH